MAMRDHRTCTICIEQFKVPKLLPCFHTFCCNCLKHYVSNSAVNGRFSCPICRAEVKVPEGGVEEFQRNFYIEGDGDTCAEALKTSCHVCSNHATRKCLDCMQFLCQSCTANHNSLTAFKTHSIIKLGGLSEESEITCKPQFCMKHKAEIVRFYCRPCEKPICRDCKLTSHEGHKTEDLCDLVNDAKSYLTKTKVHLEHCIECLDTKLRIMDARKNSMENKRLKMHADINKLADRIIAEVNDYRTSELNRIDDIVQREVACLETLGESWNEILLNKQNLQAQIYHVTMALSNGLEADTVTAASEIKKLQKDVKCEKEAHTAARPSIEKMFIKNPAAKQWMNVFTNIATVFASKVVASNSDHLKPTSTFHCISHSIDLIGPLSNTSSAWIGCKSEGCRNNDVYLVSETGVISKRMSLHKDLYNKVRMEGLLSLLTGEGSSCQTSESNVRKQVEFKPDSGDDLSLPKAYRFPGKNVPVFHKKENGDTCLVDTTNKVVQICLADGAEFTCNIGEDLEHRIGFYPRDVCWGLKDDVFIADCGLNVVHQYQVTEGFKSSFLPELLAFSPTAVAMDSRGKLWIGENNGRISVCDVYK